MTSVSFVIVLGNSNSFIDSKFGAYLATILKALPQTNDIGSTGFVKSQKSKCYKDNPIQISVSSVMEFII